MIRTRLQFSVATITVAIWLLLACGASGVLKSFRLALASSSPLVNSLVSSGAIDQAKATAIISDFDAAAQCGVTLESAFRTIPSDLSERERTARKLNASVNALRCFRTVSSGQNFTAHPRVKQVADIAEGVLASLVVFYSEPGEMQASAVKENPGAGSVVVARDEQDLERQLKARVKALEAAMKP